MRRTAPTLDPPRGAVKRRARSDGTTARGSGGEPVPLDITQALAYASIMSTPLRNSAAVLGSRGGRAGVGATKRRGDSDFYRRLVALRKDRTAAGTGMRHRHLAHHDYTLAAIDDIISNGRRPAWERLRLALLQEPGIRDKILRICDARVQEPSAQRHHFWRQYAQETRPAAP